MSGTKHILDLTQLNTEQALNGWKKIPIQEKQKRLTRWTPFAEKTKYFEPSAKDFMINYRVENLEALVEELKKEGNVIL